MRKLVAGFSGNSQELSKYLLHLEMYFDTLGEMVWSFENDEEYSQTFLSGQKFLRGI
jgi:hypothetical protein